LRDNMKSYVPDRQGHDFRYSIEAKKIASLGFEALVNFSDGLKATIDWYITNPGWWDTQSKEY